MTKQKNESASSEDSNQPGHTHSLIRVLDDILVKLAFSTDPTKKDKRILCGQDNKIG